MLLREHICLDKNLDEVAHIIQNWTQNNELNWVKWPDPPVLGGQDQTSTQEQRNTIVWFESQ